MGVQHDKYDNRLGNLCSHALHSLAIYYMCQGFDSITIALELQCVEYLQLVQKQ